MRSAVSTLHRPGLCRNKASVDPAVAVAQVIQPRELLLPMPSRLALFYLLDWAEERSNSSPLPPTHGYAVGTLWCSRRPLRSDAGRGREYK